MAVVFQDRNSRCIGPMTIPTSFSVEITTRSRPITPSGGSQMEHKTISSREEHLLQPWSPRPVLLRPLRLKLLPLLLLVHGPVIAKEVFAVMIMIALTFWLVRVVFAAKQSWILLRRLWYKELVAHVGALASSLWKLVCYFAHVYIYLGCWDNWTSNPKTV